MTNLEKLTSKLVPSMGPVLTFLKEELEYHHSPAELFDMEVYRNTIFLLQTLKEVDEELAQMEAKALRKSKQSKMF